MMLFHDFLRFNSEASLQAHQNNQREIEKARAVDKANRIYHSKNPLLFNLFKEKCLKPMLSLNFSNWK